eukprot:6477618-Amphidinium_carterae.1
MGDFLADVSSCGINERSVHGRFCKLIGKDTGFNKKLRFAYPFQAESGPWLNFCARGLRRWLVGP